MCAACPHVNALGIKQKTNTGVQEIPPLVLVYILKIRVIEIQALKVSETTTVLGILVKTGHHTCYDSG